MNRKPIGNERPCWDHHDFIGRVNFSENLRRVLVHYGRDGAAFRVLKAVSKNTIVEEHISVERF